MSDAPRPPLTPEEKEAYARRLKATLKTSRPRKNLRMFVALLALVAVVALVWYVNRPLAVQPPAVIACLDGVGCVGKPVRTEAWLKVVEVPEEKSVGLPVHWQRVDQASEFPVTKTDARGIAETTAPPPDAESVRTMQATLQDLEPRYDRGRVFTYPPRSRFVIVPIAPMTAAHVLSADQEVASPTEIAQVAAWRSAGWRVIYAVRAGDPISYRKLRGWVHSQVPRGLPDGPVLLSFAGDVNVLIPQVNQETLPESAVLWGPETPK